jgi:hypothetical protein
MVGLAPPSLLGSGSRHCYGINYTQRELDDYGLMVKESEFESPMHVAFSLLVNGVVTLISAVPAFAISEASMTAINWVELRTVVCPWIALAHDRVSRA